MTDHMEEAGLRLRVDPYSRLIQDQELGIVYKRPGQKKTRCCCPPESCPILRFAKSSIFIT